MEVKTIALLETYIQTFQAAWKPRITDTAIIGVFYMNSIYDNQYYFYLRLALECWSLEPYFFT